MFPGVEHSFFHYVYLCFGTYREKVSLKVQGEAGKGTYEEKAHKKVLGEVGEGTYREKVS